MANLFEDMGEESLAHHEKYFFEEICKIPTGDRNSFSTPLPQYEGLHFACVQDTVERLIEEGGTGRLSKFQWRNFIFAPVDRRIRVKDMYERIFNELRQTVPSIFIRSYVYLVFIRVYGSGALSLGRLIGGEDRKPNPRDFQVYQWNTNYEIVRTSPSKLAEIGRSPGRKQDEGIGESAGAVASTRGDVPHVERVFIVADPSAELQRIQDANSDVIDAVRAFTGSLVQFNQTAEMLQDVKATLKKSGSRVLLEGPARSGKTIIAMSLLASDPNAKMLLMNWYFYDALRDAFRVWAKQDESEIARLFESSESLRKMVKRDEADHDLLEIVEQDPRILPALIEMWRNPPARECLASWKQRCIGNGEYEWLLAGCTGKKAGDIVYVWQQSMKCIQLQVIDKVLGGGLARPNQELSISNFYNRRYDIDLQANIKEGPGKWADIPDHLEELYNQTEREGIAETIAGKIKSIATALDENNQRFFHHDWNHQAGLWYEKRRGQEPIPLISKSCTFICDEAQRLGEYAVDECEWVRDRVCNWQGRTFLCGDDNQRLNSRGDRGITPIIGDLAFDEFHLPESVGIPAEIGELVKAMLCEAEVPRAPKLFIKLLHKDDLGLVAAFNDDPSRKKHFAIPMSSGFYNRDYVPCIMRSEEPTDKCSSKCEEDFKGFCIHRYIRAISPISDPEWMPKRKDLSRTYKFFCAEAIMPNYALSAYELISREVESVYLKIPWQITRETLEAPIDGDIFPQAWIKRHLYVLMTRATAKLVINVEDKSLYEHFVSVCNEAAMDYSLS